MESFSATAEEQIDAGIFYEEYHGHRTSHLQIVINRFGAMEERPRLIYLAGDSSLDNKHWFFSGFPPKNQQMFSSTFTEGAVNGYESILNPPRMVMDVSYWLNRLASERLGPRKVCTINTSIEESTVSDRKEGLRPQDEIIRENISERDMLIISVGGNDVALKPTIATIINMAMLTRSPEWLIRAGWAPGMSYFVGLFGTSVEEFVRKLTAGPNKPAKVVVCMLYYLDEKPGGSWADFVLGKLGYDTNPGKLQLIIRTLYDRLVQRGFTADGTVVETFPLFTVLDGKNSDDYVQRVEPSVQGGRKMADALLRHLFPEASE